MVVGPQDLCHVVPDVPASSGYRVKCDPDGTTGEYDAPCYVLAPFTLELPFLVMSPDIVTCF